MRRPRDQSDEIAVIGMACVFPRAPDLNRYWRNILKGVCAISEVQPEHWDTSIYYDPDSEAVDRVYCRHGGFLSEEERRFRPLRFGVMPRSVHGGEPDHFLALQVATEALADAGCLDDPEARTRTGIILGKGNYINAGNMSLIQHGWVVEQTLRILKKLHPDYTDEDLEEIKKDLKASLPPFHTEVIPSLIPNLMTGRIANRLDIQGPTYTVDAACASALVATDAAVRELQDRRCDLALVGGVQGGNTLLSYLLFSPLKALSSSGELRALDAEADGTILGEGIGIVVLKRREDAERDRNPIYALIKGVGVSSDGKGAGLLAPRKEGAVLAMRRAYEDAGVAPDTIELLEAHGTGTRVGDATEIEAVQEVFGPRPALFPPCAIGSVKSMVGHLLPAAGAAGLIKAVLALYHKVLPPTLHCDDPNPRFDRGKGFFYVNTKVRPWIHGAGQYPRRAAVSAFGFGGINAHVVLEEHPGEGMPGKGHLLEWDSELILVGGKDRDAVLGRLTAISEFLRARPHTELRDLAYTLYQEASPGEGPCLSLVVRSREDLAAKLESAAKRLADPKRKQIKDRKGLYYFEEPLDHGGKVVFLFPGEGSQYPDMLADLCVLFPAVRACFDRADASFLRQGKPYLPSDAVFPRPAFREEEKETARRLLWQIDVAVESVLAANQALYLLLTSLGIRPSVMLGHSSGEYSAMLASGILEGISDDLVGETNRVIESMEKAGKIPEAVMLAAGTSREQVEEILRETGASPLFIAMDNCPHQVVLVGAEEAAETLGAALKERHILFESLPFRRGYHTPLFRVVSERLREVFRKYPISRPSVPVWSCTLKGPYPEDPDAVRDLLVDHWVEPVAFRETIEALYEEGHRLFVEVGPRGNLTAFVEDILRGRPALALPSNLPRRPGLEQLHHLLGILAAQGIPMDLTPLYEPRRASVLPLEVGPEPEAPGPPDEEPLTLSMGLPRMDISHPDRFVRKGPPPKEAEAPEPGPPPPAEGEPLGTPSFLPVDGEEALEGYFRNMEKFLQVQREVMEAYLGSAASAPPQVPPAGPGQGTGEEAGEPGGTRAAPPRRGEGAPRQAEPATDAAQREETSPTPAPRKGDDVLPPAEEGVADRIIRLVSDKTGYPPDMLDLDLDMEAELGIDSIKRVEILSTFQALSPGAADLDLDEAGRKKTLRALIEHLQGALGTDPEPSAEAAGGEQVGEPVPHLPLVGEIVSRDAEGLRCRRTFSFAEDLYLEDHVLAGPVSVLDPTRKGLAVVPLTVSMEMMAEAASLLAPGKVLVGMREVRTRRWIPVDEQGYTVEVEVRRTRDDREGQEIHAEVREVGPGTEGARGAIMSALLRFAERYPPAPSPDLSPLKGERPSRWTPERLYPEGMFHGPRFRAVKSVDRWAEDGAVATFEVLPFDRLFKGLSSPKFLADPLILDAAGQLVGFWTAEHLERGFIVFPYRCEELTLYGPLQPPGTRITCRARIELFGHLQVRSDIDLVAPGGRLWMSLRGWEDKRFDLPDSFHRFWKDPSRHRLAETWDEAIGGSEPPGPHGACWLEDPTGATEGIWERVWAHIVLDPEERAEYEQGHKTGKRRTDWLLGRTAVKDAFRALVEKAHGLQLGPQDIQVHRNGGGPPRLGGLWEHEPRLRGVRPEVTLSHAGGSSLAWVLQANGSGYGIGVDMERLPPPEGAWERWAFTEEEERLLAEKPPSEREEWKVRFWCAKESLGKALGTGLSGGPRTVTILGWGPKEDTLLAAPAGPGGSPAALAASHPVVVHTCRRKEWIVAWTWIPKPGEPV